MKKSLTALAVLAFVGTAAAQSSVTLFGVADVGVAHLSGSTLSKTGVSTGGANISRWGFRGTEDLGGGLKAGFWLEAGMNMDDGTGKGTGGGMAFNRRATVSLMGDWGELRVGRDDTPTFLSTLIFDPFLTNGVGGTMGFVMLGAPIQISNSVATSCRAIWEASTVRCSMRGANSSMPPAPVPARRVTTPVHGRATARARSMWHWPLASCAVLPARTT